MLDRRYNKALQTSTPQDAIYFSKLAVLEYCGWIEESFDNIIRRSVKQKLKTMEFRQMLERTVIGNTYGFQYKKDFRPMLTKSVGLQNSEALESFLKNSGGFEMLISELDSMKLHRNTAAHTWVSDANQTYPAPSLIKGSLEKVHPILRSIYSEIVKL